ncbi:MAG: T9SS type A sorting domain-containing protein [Bacteroidota bacterium]
MRVFPVPAQDNLNVVLPDEGKNYLIRVYSTQGKKLMKMRSKGEKHVQVETHDLPTGTYILNVTHQQKVIKGIPFSKN